MIVALVVLRFNETSVATVGIIAAGALPRGVSQIVLAFQIRDLGRA